MRGKIFIFILIGFFIINLINPILAEEFGYNLLEPGKNLNPSTNFSKKTVNASEIWITDEGGNMNNILHLYPTLDLRYLELDGSNFGLPTPYLSYSNPNFDFNEAKLNATIGDLTKTIFFNVSSILNITGNTQGALTDIQSYNNVPYNVSEDASDLELRVNFSVGVGGDFNELIVRYKSGEEDEPHRLRVQIYKINEDEWEDYGDLPEANTYSIVEFGVFDADEHIDGLGIVQVRFFQDEGVPPKTHLHNFDWVTISKGFGTPSGEEVDPDSIHKDGSTFWQGNEQGNGFNTTNWDWGFFNNLNISGNITADTGFFNRVGIGTTVSNYPLDIVGSSDGASFRLASVATDATLKTYGFTGRHYTNAEEDVAVLAGQTDDDSTIFFWGGGSPNFNTATEHRFYAAADTTTTIGDVMMTISADGVIILDDLNVTGTSYLGDLIIEADNITVNNIISKDGNISFWNSTGDKKMVITQDGDVGIGTDSPDRDLEIRDSSPIIRLRDTGATASSTTAFIEFGGTDGGKWNRTGYIGDGSSGNTDIILQAEESDLKLGDSTSYSVLTLSGGDAIFTGKVGIGTTAPTHKLNVVGDLNITGTSYLGDIIIDAENISAQFFNGKLYGAWNGSIDYLPLAGGTMTGNIDSNSNISTTQVIFINYTQTGYSVNPPGLIVRTRGEGDNVVQYPVVVQYEDFNSPGMDGIGTGIKFEVGVDDGMETIGLINARTTDVSSGTVDSDMNFIVRTDDAEVTWLNFDNSGSAINLNERWRQSIDINNVGNITHNSSFAGGFMTQWGCITGGNTCSIGQGGISLAAAAQTQYVGIGSDWIDIDGDILMQILETNVVKFGGAVTSMDDKGLDFQLASGSYIGGNPNIRFGIDKGISDFSWSPVHWAVDPPFVFANYWLGNSTNAWNYSVIHTGWFSDRLMIGNDTYSTPTYPLEVYGHNGSLVSAWFEFNISATGYITRSSVFDNSRGSALSWIKDSSEYLNQDGSIKHEEFYGGVSYNVTDYTKPVYNLHEEYACINRTERNQTIMTMIRNDESLREELTPYIFYINTTCKWGNWTETTYPFERKEEGVKLDSEIDVLRQALFDINYCILNSKDFAEAKQCVVDKN